MGKRRKERGKDGEKAGQEMDTTAAGVPRPAFVGLQTASIEDDRDSLSVEEHTWLALLQFSGLVTVSQAGPEGRRPWCAFHRRALAGRHRDMQSLSPQTDGLASAWSV